MSPWPTDSSKAARAAAVKVDEFLGPENIVIAPAGAAKDKLIAGLVASLGKTLGLSDVPALTAKVLEREQGISTTLDTGLSLPHARIDGLSKIAAALAVPRAPIAGAPSETAIRLIFLFFSPNRPEFFAAHLQLLRDVSSLFQPELIDRLSRAASPAEALGLIQQAQRAKAR